jgi:hypothetical protein
VAAHPQRVALLHTLTTTGTCVQTTATGVITVNPIAAISLTSGQVQIIKQMYKRCHKQYHFLL